MPTLAQAQSESWLNRRVYPFAPHHQLVEGGRMHYIDEGRGEPILFVHGNPTWSYLWRNYIRDLSMDGYRCVAPDHIGFGLSEKPREFVHSPAAHCRNLTRLVETLDLRDITLVVHEFGGPVGLSFAADHPERIKRIVMMNTWFWDLNREPAVHKMAKAVSGAFGRFMFMNGNLGPKTIRPQFSDREKYTDEYHAAMFGPFDAKESRTGPFRVTQQYLEAGAWYDDVWARREVFVAKPTALVWGSKDPVFGKPFLNKVWHELPLAEVKEFSDAGQFVVEERSREVMRFLQEFLRAPVRAPGYVA